MKNCSPTESLPDSLFARRVKLLFPNGCSQSIGQDLEKRIGRTALVRETNTTLGQNDFSRYLSRLGDWFPKLPKFGRGHANLSLEGLAKGHF